MPWEATSVSIGWYLPYFAASSRATWPACSSHDMENELSETGVTFLDSLSLQQQSLFAYGYRSILGQSPREKLRLTMLDSMHTDAMRDAADASLNLVFLHLPVPHAPYLYDRFTYTYPKRYLGAGSYYDNLALADVFLTSIREAMTEAGLWDQTTVLVTSDHPDRMSLSVDGKDDPRVPFLLKMPNQSSAATYERDTPHHRHQAPAGSNSKRPNHNPRRRHKMANRPPIASM